MKIFKITDCIGQIVIIVGCLIYNLVPIGEFNSKLGVNDGFIQSYLIVGTWQIISLIVHFFIPAEYKVGLRQIYSMLLLITAILILISLFSIDLLLFLILGLLYWTPVLAVLYLITCILELRKLNIAVT